MKTENEKHLKYLTEKYEDIDFYSKWINSAKKIGDNHFELGEINEDDFEIDKPRVNYVPPIELQCIITNCFINRSSWYKIKELMLPLIDEAFLSYYNGKYLSSISTIIICCEYLLKFEYSKTLEDNRLIESILEKFTLGSFIDNKKAQDFINDVKIPEFRNKLIKINRVRNGFFHFNSKKLSTITSDNKIPTSQEFDLLKVNKEIYEILNEMLGYFYSKPFEEYVELALKELKDNKTEILSKINQIYGPSGFGDELYKHKFEHFKKEYNLDIEWD
ncbi:MAG: hypothetical protein PF569_09390 [Candidatus Woesearchaeota archaeon]|jgi:hypothetical protein|nr:hypothetical protein [Candidatus Woesearchaeota archaeon]